ncbi:diguanylate cyclase domain-containing protein [Zoogloea sp.]|uniref:sensor domain-containing protein n=1 Tax=Zoogloea sp. TaxID=49181 RepID=UPI0035AF5DAF
MQDCNEDKRPLGSQLNALRGVLDGLGALIFTKDRRGVYTYANQRFCETLGTSLEAIIGCSSADFFDADTAQRLHDDDQSVLETGRRISRRELRLNKNNSEQRCYLAVKAPVFDADGHISGLSGVLIDVTEHARTEQQLRESRQMLMTVLDNVDGFVFMKGPDRRYRYVNRAFADLFLRPAEEVVGQDDNMLMSTTEAERIREIDDRVFATGVPLAIEEQFTDGQGRLRQMWAKKLLLHGCDDALLGFATDITELKAAEEELKRSEARFRVLFEASHEALVVFDEEHLIDCNQSTLELLGVPSRKAFRSLTASMLAPRFQPCGGASSKLAARHMEAARSNGHHQLEWTVMRHDNHAEIPVEVTLSALELDGQPALLATIRDLTERKRYEEQIHQLAYYDALTQLPNRRLFFDRLAQSLARSQRSGRHGAIIYLDLDNFKPLNDRHGHKAGDLLLQEVARRLSACLREEDTVARLGGDEFAVLLAQIDNGQPDGQRDATQRHALDVAERIRDALAQPYLLSMDKDGVAAEQVEHHCSASVGVTLFPPCEVDGEAMLRRADAAMYAAKAAGRNQIRFAED